jgi:putative acyl-CoA dehydrogenase
MGYLNPNSVLRTHSVENQPAPLEFVNAFESDIVLKDAVEREGGGWASDNLTELGARVFDPEWIEKANLANRIVPELRRFNRLGQRVDTVEFHPAYHEIMGLALKHQVHALPWRANRGGGHVAYSAPSISSTASCRCCESSRACPSRGSR